MVRAMESRRPDRLFRDPYAAAFLAAAPEVFTRADRGAVACLSGVSRTGAEFWSRAVIRTRFFDDYLLDAAGAGAAGRGAGGGIRQVVLLAAGLDTRAYRLNWPADVVLFELDFADVLAFKQQVLGARAAVPRCDRRPVAADLRQDWAAPSTEAGFNPGQPTAWLLEGLLIYLSAAEIGHLLSALTALSAAGSRVAFEFDEAGAQALRQQARGLPGMTGYADLWKEGLPDPVSWLASRGWLVELHGGPEVATSYGRSPAALRQGGFLTATQA
jgi:methyltransferase (TIGR00027 family)